MMIFNRLPMTEEKTNEPGLWRGLAWALGTFVGSYVVIALLLWLAGDL